MLDEVVIQDNKVMSIKKSGSVSSNTGSGSGSSGSSGSSGTSGQGSMSSAQYNDLLAKINQLQTEVNTLKADKAGATDLQTVENKVNSAQSQIDNMITNLNVNTRETLFSGSANAKGKYNMQDIADYKYLIVYADCNNATSGRGMTVSQVINTSDIQDGAGGQYSMGLCIDGAAKQGYDYAVTFSFEKSPSKLVITSIRCDTPDGKSWSSPRIYKIDGIK